MDAAPDTTPVAPAPAPDGIIRHRLKKPIEVPGDARNPKVSLDVLDMREPTGGDIARYGNPVKFNPFGEQAEITFDEGKMTAMIGGLAGIPPVALAAMDPQDWVSVAWKLSGFFLPAA